MRGSYKARPQQTLTDLTPAARERIEAKLVDLLAICEDASLDELGWIGAACLRLMTMRIGGQWPPPEMKGRCF